MSAGTGQLKVDNDLGKLAPFFRAAVNAAMIDCGDAKLQAKVYEAYRSEALQQLYYARGRTIKPPAKPVTNAKSAIYSWHGYGLAVDIVHETGWWSPPDGEDWFKEVANIFKKHDCKWGGDWSSPDPPHMQWGRCKPSPSDTARQLLATGGLEAVWDAVK
jgi:D-alanyl-D-alanine carboxypeptidase